MTAKGYTLDLALWPRQQAVVRPLQRPVIGSTDRSMAVTPINSINVLLGAKLWNALSL